MLAKSRRRPEAIVCCNDLVALGVYDALNASGIRIPQDISVTGHNDMPLVDLVAPPLTITRAELGEGLAILDEALAVLDVSLAVADAQVKPV